MTFSADASLTRIDLARSVSDEASTVVASVMISAPPASTVPMAISILPCTRPLAATSVERRSAITG